VTISARARQGVLRAGWGVADQALSSLANLAVGALVARAVSPASFGAFGLVFSTYLIVLGACRALVAEPLVVRFSARRDAEWRSATRAATGSALALGIAAGLGCALVGFAAGGVFGQALLALGVVLPGLVLQDTWRYAFFAAGRGRKAFTNDLASAAALPALAALSYGTHAVGLFVLVWGAAGTLAALLASLQAGFAPAPIAGPSWIRRQRDLGFPYLGEFAALGAGEAALFGVAGLAGLAAAGALRAGQILVGPLRVLFLGVRLAAVPEGVRLLRDPRSSPRAAAVRLSALLAGVALAWGALLTILPHSLGESLVGRSWSEARHVMVPLSLAMAGTGAVTGAVVGLRALAAARRSLRARILVTPVMVLGTLAGAAAAGAPGTAWGIAIVTWLSLGLWWRQFLGALAERRQPAEAERPSRGRVALRPHTPVEPRA
jgi:O-antigen/teichoic acid export membrane protein